MKLFPHYTLVSMSVVVGSQSNIPRVYEDLDELFADLENDLGSQIDVSSLPIVPPHNDRIFYLSENAYGSPCVSGYLVTAGPSAPRSRCFTIDLDHNLVYLRGTYSDYSRAIMLVPSDGEGNLYIARHNSRAPDNWQQYEDVMGIGHGSDFARLVGSVMLVPLEVGVPRTQLALITAPTDPESFCTESVMARIALLVSSSGRLELEVDVSLEDRNSGEIVPMERSEQNPTFFFLSTYKLTFIPSNVRASLVEIMNRVGLVRTVPNTFSVGCENLINFLPSIVFTVKDAGVVAARIVLEPQDYFHIRPETRECGCKIDLSDPEPVEHARFSFGMSLLENAGIFIDYNNEVLGLCDPL